MKMTPLGKIVAGYILIGIAFGIHAYIEMNAYIEMTAYFDGKPFSKSIRELVTSTRSELKACSLVLSIIIAFAWPLEMMRIFKDGVILKALLVIIEELYRK